MPTTDCVFIRANRNGAVAIGVTTTRLRRVWEHRTGSGAIHAATSHITRHVEVERKGWRRAQTVALIGRRIRRGGS